MSNILVQNFKIELSDEEMSLISGGESLSSSLDNIEQSMIHSIRAGFSDIRHKVGERKIKSVRLIMPLMDFSFED